MTRSPTATDRLAGRRGHTKKLMREWVQRRDVLRAAARAFNERLDEQGIEVAGNTALEVEINVDIFRDIQLLTKPEAIRLLTGSILAGFERHMRPQGSA